MKMIKVQLPDGRWCMVDGIEQKFKKPRTRSQVRAEAKKLLMIDRKLRLPVGTVLTSW